MKYKLPLLVLVIAAVSAFSAAVFSFSTTKYGVYCADGRIEVDGRTLDEMKSARGSNVCKLREFDSVSDAEKWASTMGGKGAACSCN